jgi:hypothetical protein
MPTSTLKRVQVEPHKLVSKKAALLPLEEQISNVPREGVSFASE